MTLNIGDKAPDFTLQSDQNKSTSLKDFLGKKVILYFYPKDNTPVCTRQACNFRDELSQFHAANTFIIGVSRDNPDRHQKFKHKYSLPFTLVSDENGDVSEAYGVLNKKSLFGWCFLGIQRSTFLIDEKGYIRGIWRKVKVTGHTKQVLDELKQS